MRLILFIFAGRRENMEVQRPYLDRILAQYPDAELHLWDLARTSADRNYLASRDGDHEGRVKVMTQLRDQRVPCLYPNGLPARMPRGYPRCQCMVHKPPYERPYKWYALHPEEYSGAVFVKLDDDVLFLETERFEDLIVGLKQHPERVYSANVVNNAVCAKYEPALVQLFAGVAGPPPEPESDYRWWQLHEEALFSKMSHAWFLENAAHLTDRRKKEPSPVRTREGERVSINCIAFSFATMQHLAEAFRGNPRLGDEGAVDDMLPWIVPTFRAAHLTFGPQEKTMSEAELTDLRNRYTDLSREYLS